MSQSNGVALVLFPGALGDFLLFLPTLFALAERHEEVVLVARAEWTALLAHPRVRCWPPEHPAVAALFRESFIAADWQNLFSEFQHVYSWTGYGIAPFSANLAKVTRYRSAVFPFRAFQPSEHAIDYYSRCVGLRPVNLADVVSYIRFSSSPLLQRLQGLPGPLLAVHPGSGAIAKNWQGFPSLVARWKKATRGQVIVLLGPAELERGTAVPRADVQFVGRPLPEVAALLRIVSFYVGNDSGVSHLAALLGTRTVVLMGPQSTPQHWRPHGDRVFIVSAPAPCVQCGPTRLCEHLVSSSDVLELLARAHP